MANHSKFEEHTGLGIHLDNPFYYTILREPVARFISHYNFFYYQQGLDGCKDIPFENLSEKKQQYLIQKMANLQIRYLSNEVITLASDMQELYRKAKFNLQNHYAAFGILEKMDTTIQQFIEKAPFGLKCDIPFPVLNKNKINLNISSNTKADIQKANYWDIQLYNWAVNEVLNTVDTIV